MHQVLKRLCTNQEGLNYEEVCRELVLLCLEDNSIYKQTDDDGNSILHHAVYSGDVRIVSLMLRLHGEVDTTNKSKETPLHWACQACPPSLDIVQFLLEKGSSPLHKSRGGTTPYRLAEDGESMELMALMKQYSSAPSSPTKPWGKVKEIVCNLRRRNSYS